ncbi:MAG: hypothetical protein JWP41_2385 [Ramlibacter sp.]|jgi:hypothetical protein|nr:hypothetical protein [Ramlibacter sp.]
MKAVLQKLFQPSTRREDAWAATDIQQPDTQVLGHPVDEELWDTVPMELLATSRLS